MRVSVGDIVAVYTPASDDGWEPAEVLCLYKSAREIEKPSQTEGEDKNDQHEEVQVEIRWLYTPFQIMSGKQLSSLSDEVKEGELWETDHIDTCTADSIVWKISLFPTPIAKDISHHSNNIYCCRRFYAAQRKAHVTGGAFASMSARGRMHSLLFSKDPNLRAAYANIMALSGTPIIESTYDKNNNNNNNMNTFQAQIQEDSNATSDDNPKKPLSALAASISKFALAAVPNGPLRGREAEQSRVIQFIKSGILRRGKSDSALFVGGPPGTGKTATVCAAIAILQKSYNFRFVKINGMELRQPFDAYTVLWEAISKYKETKSAGIAAEKLEKFFDKKLPDDTDEPMTVVLLDEMDYLVTKKQTVLYNFFDWPTRGGGGGLVIVGISNTINLPERLPSKVQSRLGLSRITFMAYKKEQIIQILKARLGMDKEYNNTGNATNNNNEAGFTPEAIGFVAAKAAGFSGDLRKAFQICKNAAELVLQDPSRPQLVAIPDVTAALKSIAASPHLKAVKTATDFEALVIVSVASVINSSGRDSGGAGMQEILTKMSAIASASGESRYMPIPNWNDLLEMLNRLGHAKVLLVETPKVNSSAKQFAAGCGGGGLWPLVLLNMDGNDVYDSLKDSSHDKLVAKNLPKN
jgi:origin recognition complex subunit 1